MRLGSRQRWLLRALLRNELHMHRHFPTEPRGLPIGHTDHGNRELVEVEINGEHLNGRAAYQVAERLQELGLVEIRLMPHWDAVLTAKGRMIAVRLDT